MTAGATKPVVQSERENGAEYGDDASRWAARPVCVITADGTYGARLARDGESWYPERWTLDGPEPYAVPLPGPQPEEPGTEVQPLTDGRVLIHRADDGRHAFSLLYPTGPGTGELPLGAVECPDVGTVLRLLPPAPDGERAYALAVGRGSTAVWLVAGGAFGPEHLAEVPGHCSGGVWLDRTGRLLALDRFQNGRTKTVVVDLERGGEVSPLLQIADHSNDRLLLADADSGLLLIRSDAPSPGRDRLGWGVLGSALPVRFPDCLTATGCSITPFAIQPGQVLMPESCGVALRIDGPGGTWVGLWRPSERRIHHRPAPEGWLPGAGLWTPEGVLRLPYATGVVPCGVAWLGAPGGTGEPDTGDPAPPARPARHPVPLQQAPLKIGRPAGPPHPAPRTGPARTPPVHLALSTHTARAPGAEATRAADGAGASHATAGHTPEGPETLSTVTSLTTRTAPAEARRADTNPGDEPAGALPPAVRLATQKAEPLRPDPRPITGTTEPVPPQPSRWIRVSETPMTEPKPRTKVTETPTTEPGLWTKVAETPPPGMSLRSRADGTLPGGMTLSIETTEPLPPVMRIGGGAGAEAEAGSGAGAGVGSGTGSGTGAGVGAGTGAGASAGRIAPAGPLPPVTGHGARTAGPLPAVAGPAHRTAESLPAVASPAHRSTGPLPAVASPAHRTTGPLPAVASPAHRTTGPLPAVAGPAHRTGQRLPAVAIPGSAPAEPPPPAEHFWTRAAETPTTEPNLWTKVAETPPPGMSLGTRTGGTLPADTGLGGGYGNGNAPSAFGEFRGQVALRTAVSRPGFEAEPASALAAVSKEPAEFQEEAGPRTAPPVRRALHAGPADAGPTSAGTGPLQPTGPVSGDAAAPPAGSAGAVSRTDGEERDDTGEETSPSDSRSMTAR
ncbi:hypothetical protein ACWGKW_11515 [Streptomyces sp. NPDC054766]